MAYLSDTTYNRLAKANDAGLTLINSFGEFSNSVGLITLSKTKSKIKTRWATTPSSNIHPFSYAVLTIKGKQVVMSAIKPLERTSAGWIDIEYESE